MEKCPIKGFKKYLIENNIATTAEIEAIEGKVRQEIADASKFAKESPFPDPSEALEDVYA